MEIVRDPALFQAVRSEVLDTLVTDPATGTRSFDIQKLLALPLLQSIYIEAMRMHVSANITRQVTRPISLEGYHLAKGSLLQAPTGIAHYDETVWGKEGHPATEFWAERNIKYVEKVDADGQTMWTKEFSMAGRPSDFFPYGGGVSMCPGRHFAKQEIMLTLAMLVSRFDVEVVGWTMMDGSKSDRPAQDNTKYAGTAAMPPDRDLELRWKRLW
jgi:cytochrome P450